jgi:deoxyribodipyrimidine photolyase
MATKDLHAPGGPVAPGQLAFDGASGYPEPIVDHGRERHEALARFEAARTRGER